MYTHKGAPCDGTCNKLLTLIHAVCAPVESVSRHHFLRCAPFPFPPPFQASKASFSMPSTDPKTLSDDSTRLIALLYLFLLYTQQSVCAHTHTHTAFRLLFCFLLYIFPVKFWRSTKVSERERDWRLIGGDSCRLPLTSRPPRYLSQPFSRILLPRMARKRSNSLLPRSKATIGSVQQLAKTPN